MANSEEEKKPCKIEKPSSPAKDEDQNMARVYPDWAMMQAYYGPQFTVPPYLNSAVASPHIPPPYMWMVPPQYMVPPYGASYPGYFSHEGAYGHPGASMAGTSFSIATQAESSGNTGGGLVKESGDSHELAVSIGNENAEHGPDRRLSESEVTDDSGDGSNGVKEEAGRSGVKRRRQAGSPKSTKCGKNQKKGRIGVGRGCRSMKVETSCPSNTPAKTIESTPELKDPSILDVKPVAAYKPQSSAANEAPLQGTPNVPEVKWEKRKQSNRESARRSRLRKLAEAEELAATVQALIAENVSLKSELSEFMNFSKKLELENGALMERLKDARPGEVDFHGVRAKPVDTVNLLARVESNGASAEGTDEEDGDDSYEQRSHVAKLHQLLDAVAAS